MPKIFRLTCLCVLLWCPQVHADKVDEFIENVMEKKHIPGVSMAIIQEGKIIKTTAYGVIDKETKAPVKTNTLFQAGSISKPVSTLGVLHLVDEKKLSLDEDVNGKLRSWKVPENEFTKDEKVTLRRILSHSAGLTVHGFPGYNVLREMPTLVQVLDGAKPANTAPIRVDTPPGSKSRYSGGGFTVMQQLVIDVSGEPFPSYMSNIVLAPLGMTSSTFEQPPPKPFATNTAHGYFASGNPVKGWWHVYPEMAAAGLWTTPTDLARCVIAIQQAYAGTATPVISKSTAHEMLTRQKENTGLSLFLAHAGKNLRFEHAGRDEGFDALMVGYAEQGAGLTLMINCNDDNGAVTQIVDFVAREYGWPD